MFKTPINTRKRLEGIPYLLTFLVCLLSTIALQTNSYRKLSEIPQNPNYSQEEEKQGLSLEVKKVIPDSGFSNLLADLSYLQFIQYFGDKKGRQITGYSLVPKYFETIVNYDPQFTDAHLKLSIANTMYAGKPDKTVTIMDKAIDSSTKDYADSHLLWLAKAQDELLFLGDINAAKKSYQIGGYLALKNKPEQAREIAKSNRQKAEYLATNPDTRSAQIIAWSSVLPHVVNYQERQKIIDRIQSLKAELAIDRELENNK